MSLGVTSNYLQNNFKEDKSNDLSVYEFEDFRLDAAHLMLYRNEEVVALTPKVVETLVALVERRGEVVSKDELMDRLWSETAVEESNLSQNLYVLRKTLGNCADGKPLIETFRRRGYRFNGELKQSSEIELLVATHTKTLTFAAEEINETNEQIPTADRGSLSQSRRSTLPFAARFVLIAVLPLSAVLILVLATVWLWRGENKTEQDQLKLTKLTTSSNITNATLTPDGRFAVLSQNEDKGESLWLRQLETGSQTRITPPQSVNYLGLTVSPDNNFVYASVFVQNKADTPLWKIPVLGGAAEEIPDIYSAVAVSFAPDGKRFAFIESSSLRHEDYLKIADSDGANKRLLIRASRDKRSIWNYRLKPVAWSPDGDEIAVAVNEKLDDGGIGVGILLVNPNDGTEKYLLEPRFAHIKYLAWIDGEHLAFIGHDRDEWSNQIWSVSRTTGETRHLTNDLQRYSSLESVGGNLLTVQQNSLSHIQIADFDEQLKTLHTREILSDTSIYSVAWAKDGTILYSTRTTGKSEIWGVQTDGSNPTQITSNANLSYRMTVSPVDGSLVFSAQSGGKHSLYLADATGKNIRRLTDGVEDLYPQFTPDGKMIIFQRGINEATVWRILANGEGLRQLTRQNGLKPTPAPDSQTTAFYFMDLETDGLWRIGLVSNESGAMIGKLDFPTFVTSRQMRWHPSGRFITQIYQNGENNNLMLLPVDGGEAQIISGLGKGDVNQFEWTPNGRQIVVSQTTMTQDAVLIRNF